MNLSTKNKLKSLITASAGYIVLASTRVYAANSAQEGADKAKPDGVPTSLTGSTGAIKDITNTLLLAIGVIAVVVIIIAGIRFVTSSGNESSTKAARETILYAVIGLVVALLSYAIVNFVLGIF
jgi:hypothetical protein